MRVNTNKGWYEVETDHDRVVLSCPAYGGELSAEDARELGAALMTAALQLEDRGAEVIPIRTAVLPIVNTVSDGALRRLESWALSTDALDEATGQGRR